MSQSPRGAAASPVDPWSRTSATNVAIGDREVAILHPARSDDLISEADYVLDERLPYWADIWPSSRVLAAEVYQFPKARGLKLIEMGCGLGLVSLAARLAGFDVLATDYYKPALEFAKHNVHSNGGGDLRTLHWNWRDDFPLNERFDVVVASDILYEKEYGVLVARLLLALLQPHGTAIIADPGRIASADFLARVRATGFEIVQQKKVPIVDEGRAQTVDVYYLARRPVV